MAREYEWQGTTLTASGWARRLAITPRTFYYRVRKFGPADPRTYDVTWDYRHDAQARLALMSLLAETMPEIRTGSLTGRIQAQAIKDELGLLTLEEIAVLLGCTRERVRQREDAALKRLRLRLGPASRDWQEGLQEPDAPGAIRRRVGT